MIHQIHLLVPFFLLSVLSPNISFILIPTTLPRVKWTKGSDKYISLLAPTSATIKSIDYKKHLSEKHLKGCGSLLRLHSNANPNNNIEIDSYERRSENKEDLLYLLWSSSVWLIKEAMVKSNKSGTGNNHRIDDDAIFQDPKWRDELQTLIMEELLPAALQLPQFNDLLSWFSNFSPDETLSEIYRLGCKEREDNKKKLDHSLGDMDSDRTRDENVLSTWDKTNGLLLSIGGNAPSLQPKHRWLIGAAGYAKLLHPKNEQKTPLYNHEKEVLPSMSQQQMQSTTGSNFDEVDDYNDLNLVGNIYAASPGAPFPPTHSFLSRSIIIIFEATAQYGVGALVLNHPTPLHLGDLLTSRFQDSFSSNVLYAGGSFGGGDGRLAPAEMSPWYWLHPYEEELVSGSSKLSNAAFLGGNAEALAEVIKKNDNDGADSVRFFWKHTAFEAGEFEAQLEKNMWKRLPDYSWSFF